MKPVLPFLIFTTTLFSCASVYKTGQTPDDVYFSPARPQADYVRVDEQNNDQRRREQTIDESEERYSRMRLRNRRQWSQVDDYYVDPRAYYYNPYFVNPYAMQHWGWGADRMYWNNWHNPYGNRVIVVSPNNRNNGRIRNYNPYTTPQTNNSYKYQAPSNNQRSNTGSRLRGLFNDGGNNSSSSPSYKGGSGGSNNSSGGSSPSRSSSAPVRRY